MFNHEAIQLQAARIEEVQRYYCALCSEPDSRVLDAITHSTVIVIPDEWRQKITDTLGGAVPPFLVFSSMIAGETLYVCDAGAIEMEGGSYASSDR